VGHRAPVLGQTFECIKTHESGFRMMIVLDPPLDRLTAVDPELEIIDRTVEPLSFQHRAIQVIAMREFLTRV
jgi:hypothetical protein